MKNSLYDDLHKTIKSNTIVETVCNVCHKVLNIDVEFLKTHGDTTLTIDSLDKIEIFYMLDNIYDINVNDIEFNKIYKINDIVSIINQYIVKNIKYNIE